VTPALGWNPVPEIVTLTVPPTLTELGEMLVAVRVGVEGGVAVEVGIGPEVGVGVAAETKVAVEVAVGDGSNEDDPPTAAAALIRPCAVKFLKSVPVPLVRSAVLSIRFRTQPLSLGLQRLVDQMSPAKPATCGVAMDVPLREAYPPVPDPQRAVLTFGAVDRISAPGAATSTQLPP
jgi:hypothetical protein